MNAVRTFVMAKNVFQEIMRDRILYIIGFYAFILGVAESSIDQFVPISQENIFLLDWGLTAINII